MENNDKPKILGKIDLTPFLKKNILYSVLELQYEFNADWRSILDFLIENNFKLSVDVKNKLNYNHYNFLKSNFKTTNCKTYTIKNLDIEAELVNTTVNHLIEYLTKAKISFQLSENKNEIINLDFKSWSCINEIINCINIIPIEEILNYKEQNIDIKYEKNIHEPLDVLENKISKNKNNSYQKGLYDISINGYRTNNWNCNLCDGDSESGCQLSDKSRCIM
jgi:hypothetical protein